MDEALGDRAPRKLHDREDRACARAGLEARRGRGGERDELRRFEPARRDPAAGEGEVGDRGHARAKVAGGERPLGIACEHERRRVVLPDDFERRCGRARVELGDGLGRHQPSKIGATADVPRPPDAYAPQVEGSMSFISASPPCISPVAAKPQRS
jgi:hypothetical protein